MSEDNFDWLDEPKQDKTFASVVKVDETLGLVMGFAIICTEGDEAYFDVQGDHIPEDAMLKAAADFMINSRAAKQMHDGPDVGQVVFAFPLTYETAAAMGINQYEKTGLMIAMKFDDPAIVDKFKSGEYKGFSIGGQRMIDEEID